MNGDSGVQFVAARPRKRPHHQMSESSRSQQSRWRSSAEPSSSQRYNSPHSRPPLPQMRYPGDGYDFRRPIMSDSPLTEDVIDLTNEPDSPEDQRRPQTGGSRTPRLPRFGRDIMAEVVDLEEPEDIIRVDSPSSPEVQFVGATVRQPEPAPAPPPRNRSFIGANLWDLIRFQREIAPRHFMSREQSFRHEIAWRARDLPRRPPDEVDMFLLGAAEEAIDLEDAMDLAIVGDRSLRVEYPTSGLTSDRGYKPPSPPSEGFTRSAGEDDLVICPNCDEELGTGDETKQQIWVAKPCGHVYCGECARNRAVSKAKKTPQKTKPFSKCQVIDCGKPTMIGETIPTPDTIMRAAVQHVTHKVGSMNTDLTGNISLGTRAGKDRTEKLKRADDEHSDSSEYAEPRHGYGRRYEY